MLFDNYVRVYGSGFSDLLYMQWGEPFEAQEVMTAYPDIIVAFGESDEYSFIFSRKTKLFGNLPSCIMTMRNIMNGSLLVCGIAMSTKVVNTRFFSTFI
jgi:tRNA(His) 5'-end guanylyltransferase